MGDNPLCDMGDERIRNEGNLKIFPLRCNYSASGEGSLGVVREQEEVRLHEVRW